jgi:RecA-family ATPase
MSNEIKLTANTPDEILKEINRLDLEEKTSEPVEGEQAKFPRFVTSFSEFMSRKSADGELIGFHAFRGEVVLIQSVTNKGKSTLARNAAIALATGKGFAPQIDAGKPRKVILLNYEGAEQRFRNDLEIMTEVCTPEEVELLKENFFPTHNPNVEGEPVTLPRHMDWLADDAREHKADVIIIDTASTAFSIMNENDNAQVANLVMKPLARLARELNCVVVLIHHIGKSKSEEGQAREAAHRARGASAFGDYSTSIFNLESNSGGADCRTLTCGKRKDGGEEYSVNLRLDRIIRWFGQTNESLLTKVRSKREIVRAAVTRPMKKSEIVAALEGSDIAERTIERCLSLDIQDSFLIHPEGKKGFYAPADWPEGYENTDSFPF